MFPPIFNPKSTTPESPEQRHARLLRERVILLDTSIDDRIAQLTVARLLFLEAESSNQGITFLIDSPGGDVVPGFAIYDTIDAIRPDVSTFCIGQASGIAALLLARGTPGKRFAVPDAQFLLFPPLSTTLPKTPEVEAEIERIRELCFQEFARCTGQSPEHIAAFFKDEMTLDTRRVLHLGLIDQIKSAPDRYP